MISPTQDTHPKELEAIWKLAQDTGQQQKTKTT